MNDVPVPHATRMLLAPAPLLLLPYSCPDLINHLSAPAPQFGVEGVFMTGMAAAAAALVQRNSNLQHVLALFFRDDLLAWMTRHRRPQVRPAHCCRCFGALQPALY